MVKTSTNNSNLNNSNNNIIQLTSTITLLILKCKKLLILVDLVFKVICLKLYKRIYTDIVESNIIYLTIINSHNKIFPLLSITKFNNNNNINNHKSKLNLTFIIIMLNLTNLGKLLILHFKELIN
jgi:hypothetical protein